LAAQSCRHTGKWCCRHFPAGRPPSAVIPAPKAAAGCRERAGVPVSPAAGPARRESHPPAVCATSTEAEARAGCIYPQRQWPGRCPLSDPRAAAPTQARRGGALERRNPLKYFHIFPRRNQPFTPPAEAHCNIHPNEGVGWAGKEKEKVNARPPGHLD
jgi:hypothetical protein